jgi:ABC-type transporter MlaC component
MNNHKRTTYPLILALLVAGYLTMSPAAKAAGPSGGDSEQVSKLLSEAKTEAHELEFDAEKLATFTRSKLSWKSHLSQISLIGEHVNKAGKILARLNVVRDTASPWQQQAIDSIHRLLKELADNTEATMNHLNGNKDRIHVNREYKDYVVANYDLAKELAALITDYVDYGKHEAEYQRLQEKLRLATS